VSESKRRNRGQGSPRGTYQIEELFQTMMLSSSRTGSLRGRGGRVGAWRPAVDVYEADGTLTIVTELAGVREEQISVALDENILRIRGERTPLCEDPERSVHEIGILYGPFAADIYLPFAVDHDGVEALYENGILQVRLRRIAPTQISVTYSDS
jgi:HSP20 family protein